MSPASILDCEIGSALLNISFTSSVTPILSQLTVSVGSVPVAIVGVQSDGKTNSVVAGPLTTSTVGSLTVTLTVPTNGSSIMQSSSNLQVIGCCGDIVAFCKTLGAIAVPRAGIDVSFGTKYSGGCDWSVCQQTNSIARASVIEAAHFCRRMGG